MPLRSCASFLPDLPGCGPLQFLFSSGGIGSRRAVMYRFECRWADWLTQNFFRIRLVSSGMHSRRGKGSRRTHLQGESTRGSACLLRRSIAGPSGIVLAWRERDRAKREDFVPWKLVLAASFARVQIDGTSAAALANPPFRQFLHEVRSKSVMYFSAPLHAGKRFHQAQSGQGFGGCSRVMTSTGSKEPTHR